MRVENAVNFSNDGRAWRRRGKRTVRVVQATMNLWYTYSRPPFYGFETGR